MATVKFKKGYNIIVDNSIARSFNVNIDRPMFFCWANTKKEAIKIMKQSDFAYKNRRITHVSID